jgi:hypothetical protein
MLTETHGNESTASNQSLQLQNLKGTVSCDWNVPLVVRYVWIEHN